ncbi:MAG: hypothetical protein QW803_12110 [Candidatus Methanomethylicia archaeon]
MIKSKKVTVRLNKGQLEILKELMNALRTDEISNAIKFCIELTGLILNIRQDYYTIGIVDAIEKATKIVKKSDTLSDKSINKV